MKKQKKFYQISKGVNLMLFLLIIAFSLSLNFPSSVYAKVTLFDTPSSADSLKNQKYLLGRIEGNYSNIHLIDPILQTDVVITSVEQKNLWLPMFDKFITVSPDGNFGTYITADNLSMSNTKLWLVDLNTLSITLLSQFSNDFWISPIIWSPDSTHLLVSKINNNNSLELWTINITTGLQNI